MRKLLGFMMAMASFAFLACSSDDESPRVVNTERTVIIYMAGENSLTADISLNLNQMKEGSRQIAAANALLVYVDRCKKNEIPWLARISNGQMVDSVSLADMGISRQDELASDPHVFEDVLQYAVRHYPATKDYGLVLWGHSVGWLMKDSLAYTRAYGVDNGRNDVSSNDGKWMNIPTMANVLKKLPHLRFLFADCCNFMCLETLYELRSVADYIIGSPAEIPDIGAPYDQIVPALFDDNQFYTRIADSYHGRKTNGLETPITVVKTSGLPELAEATRQAWSAIRATMSSAYPDMTGIIYYYYNYEKYFYYSEYRILYDAGDFIRTHAPEDIYLQWKEVFDRTAVYRKYSAHWTTDKQWGTFYGNNFTVNEQKEHGVSMFVPQSPSAGYYRSYNEDIKRLGWYYVSGLSDLAW